jgi:hypothetical protein
LRFFRLVCALLHCKASRSSLLSSQHPSPKPPHHHLKKGPDGELLLDCKAASARGGLRPPPEKPKVAHGDANLDINDFLAKFDM